ncbi:MAG: cytochrome c-type biogenesis protein CcmH [Solirubrobacteraceae bacterium]|jgi:cytochrome c-type biogenesis protein CcmH/NrfF
MKRAGLLALLVLALAPGGAAAVKQRTSMQAVLPQVMCVTCGIPLSNAESAQADDEKAFIQQLIDRGDTLSQIKRALVAQYGNAVLALPPAQGFDLTVYVVPVVVVLGLLAALVVLLPRWRRNRPPPGAAGTAGPTALSKEDAARLDADLARYD